MDWAMRHRLIIYVVGLFLAACGRDGADPPALQESPDPIIEIRIVDTKPYPRGRVEALVQIHNATGREVEYQGHGPASTVPAIDILRDGEWHRLSSSFFFCATGLSYHKLAPGESRQIVTQIFPPPEPFRVGIPFRDAWSYEETFWSGTYEFVPLDESI